MQGGLQWKNTDWKSYRLGVIWLAVPPADVRPVLLWWILLDSNQDACATTSLQPGALPFRQESVKWPAGVRLTAVESKLAQAELSVSAWRASGN